MVNTKTVDGEATLDLIAGIRFVSGVPESLASEWDVRRVVEERPEGTVRRPPVCRRRKRRRLRKQRQRRLRNRKHVRRHSKPRWMRHSNK